MADISKSELREEITAILKKADLSTMSAKKVRQRLEEKLDCDLSSRKKEIDELVMEYVNSKDKKSKNDSEEEEEEDGEDKEEEDEESEEEKKPAKRASTGKKPAAKKAKKASSDDSEASEGSDAEGSDEEYSPKKSAKPPKARKLPPKKKKGSDSDSDADWNKAEKKKGAAKKGGKRGGGGYTKAQNLSPELAELMGEDKMPRHEVVKRIWQLIKERDLYDPKNKQYAICDDDLFKVIGIKRFRTFGMMKYLKTHFVE